MSLARVTVWSAGQVLTAAALNGEFDNILNNPGTLISPISANLNFGNFQAVNMRLENVTSTIAAAQIGRVVFNTSDNTINVDDGTNIHRVPTPLSTGVTTGSIYLGSTAGGKGARVKLEMSNRDYVRSPSGS